MRPPESFIEQPVRSLQTMLRVIAEDDDRFPTVVPDGIYGPTTMQAVTAFQQLQGLPVTGITDQTTWEAIVDAHALALVRVGKAEPIEILLEPGQILRLGDEGPYILLMQSMLIWLSQDNDKIPMPNHTGTLDAQSAAALSAFQQLAGLPETGELDRVTWKNLSRQFTLSTHQTNAVRRKLPNP